MSSDSTNAETATSAAAAENGLSIVAQRRAIIERAELALQQAQIERPSPCAGDDRFTGEDRTLTTSLELGLICANCPIRRACADYADAVRPEAGFWAGEWRGRQDRASMNDEKRRRAADAETARELAAETAPAESALFPVREVDREERSA